MHNFCNGAPARNKFADIFGANSEFQFSNNKEFTMVYQRIYLFLMASPAGQILSKLGSKFGTSVRHEVGFASIMEINLHNRMIVCAPPAEEPPRSGRP